MDTDENGLLLIRVYRRSSAAIMVPPAETSPAPFPSPPPGSRCGPPTARLPAPPESARIAALARTPSQSGPLPSPAAPAASAPRCILRTSPPPARSSPARTSGYTIRTVRSETIDKRQANGDLSPAHMFGAAGSQSPTRPVRFPGAREPPRCPKNQGAGKHINSIRKRCGRSVPINSGPCGHVPTILLYSPGVRRSHRTRA